MTKPVELKPCPFCGGEAARNGGVVYCLGCGARTKTYWRLRVCLAETDWNKRTR